MAIGIGEVEAAAAATVVDLSVRRRARAAAVRYALGLETREDRVELRVAHDKRVVVRLEPLAIVVVERQVTIDANLREMSDRSAVLQSEYSSKEARPIFFIARRHDGVIQRDRHSASCTSP